MPDRCGSCLNCIEVAEMDRDRPCAPSVTPATYWDHDAFGQLYRRPFRDETQVALAPMMLEVGVEGDLFNPHPRNDECAGDGCVVQEAARV